MLNNLLGEELYQEVVKIIDINKITEIRIRNNLPTVIKDVNRSYYTKHIADDKYLRNIVAIATDYSLYAHQDELVTGYIIYKQGIRIGVCGRGITDGSRLLTIKDVTSLCIRIPHEINCVDSRLYPIINDFDNTIIISPPFGGKTTLIREIVRRLSGNYDISVIDERGELSAEGRFNLGKTVDVMIGVPKTFVYEGIIRAMSPDIIAVDELFPSRDIKAVFDVIRSGVKLICGIHADSYKSVTDRYPELNGVFRYQVTLSNIPTVGSIKSFERLS